MRYFLVCEDENGGDFVEIKLSYDNKDATDYILSRFKNLIFSADYSKSDIDQNWDDIRFLTETEVRIEFGDEWIDYFDMKK